MGRLRGFGVELGADRFTLFGSAEYLGLSDSSAIVSGKAGLRVNF